MGNGGGRTQVHTVEHDLVGGDRTIEFVVRDHRTDTVLSVFLDVIGVQGEGGRGVLLAEGSLLLPQNLAGHKLVSIVCQHVEAAILSGQSLRFSP